MTMTESSRAIGRPLKFATPEELQAKIDEYFDNAKDADGNFKRVTITGLALHLDTTRDTLMDYQGRDEFSDTVKKAKLRVENFYEEHLMSRSVTGAIFALKNFGWKDTQEVRMTTPQSDERDKTLLEEYAKGE